MRYYFLAVALLLITPVHATTYLTYVNGASAYGQAPEIQHAKFKSIMKAHNVDASIVFNPKLLSHTEVESASIVPCQSAISQSSFSDLNSIPGTSEYYNYLNKLGEIYTKRSDGCLSKLYIYGDKIYNNTISLVNHINNMLKKGNQVIIVGYSQGNFYIESAIAYLYYNKKIHDFNNIRVVNIGNPSATSLNGFNITSTLDTVVDLFPHFPKTHQPCIKSCQSPASTEDIITVGGTDNGHLLFQNYLNKKIKVYSSNISFPQKVADYINKAKAEIFSIANPFVLTAINETGIVFQVPQGKTSCSFVATGTWGENRVPWYDANGNPGYYVSSAILPSATVGSLIMKRSNGVYELVGLNSTKSFYSGEVVSFLFNDVAGSFLDNPGEMSIQWSCQ
jgi:hypothetical protein